MTTKTILKNDGIFVYDDYKQGRAVLRIKELDGMNPAQNIRRNSVGCVEAVLVSAVWVDAMMASVAGYKQNYTVITDDYMGSNLSKMVDLLRGRAQTRELVKPVADQGLTLNAFLTYKIVNSAEYFEDDSVAIPFEESEKKGGVVLAYVLHPTVYDMLAGATTPIVYVGTGDGTIAASLVPSGVVTETITATATDPVTFAIAGSVTGAMGNATVGTLFTSPEIEILISDGTVAFVAGDLFTITSVAM